MRLSGRLRSALIIGVQGIRARKLRTFLSMVSLFLGVLAVVTVQAGAEIANRAMLADVELTQGVDGTLQMYLPPGQKALQTTLDTLDGARDAVATLSAQAIIGEPGAGPINPGGESFEYGGGDGGYGYGMGEICDESGCRVEGPDSAAPRGQAIELQLTAMTGDVRQFRPFRLDSGQWLDFSGEASLSPRIVLNRDAAKGFAQHRVPAEMRVSGADVNPTPRIIGVVHDGGYGPAAYVRADELLNWVSLSGHSSEHGPGLQVYLSPSATDTEQVLRARLVAAGVPPEQVEAHAMNYRDIMADQLALMRWIFLGLAALVLLIGVAGILNVSLATVGERIEEFALRRAVGTPRLLLAGIVLAETLLIGLLTAAAAIGAGVLGLRAVSLVAGGQEPFLRDLHFPWQAGVAGVIAGLLAGVLGGLIPAIRASRIPIATVMRA